MEFRFLGLISVGLFAFVLSGCGYSSQVMTRIGRSLIGSPSNPGETTSDFGTATSLTYPFCFDSEVRSLVQVTPTRAIAGGYFSAVGRCVGTALIGNSTTGDLVMPATGLPGVVGQAWAAVSDGAGGWFIGGKFTKVGGVARTNLAHLQADGQVSSWTASANGAVNALHLRGSVLYVGGDFTELNGTARTRLGALDAATGSLIPGWAPTASHQVRTIASNSSLIFISGEFNSVQGVGRSKIAALDPNDGTLSPWQSSVSISNPIKIDVDESRVAILEGSISGPRGPLYVLDTTTGAEAIPGLHQLQNFAYDLKLVNDYLYVSGSMSAIGPVDSYVRGLNATTGLNDPTFSALVPDGEVLVSISDGAGGFYIGGRFSTVGGQPRQKLAHIDASGAVTSFNVNITGGNYVSALALEGSTLHVGGSFWEVDGQMRERIAEIDAAGNLLPATYSVGPGEVSDIVVLDDFLVVRGSFAVVGVEMRSGIAAFNRSDRSVNAWEPTVNGQILSIAGSGNRLFMSGGFTTVNGESRPGISAFDLSTGNLESWSPDLVSLGSNLSISKVLVTPTEVILGGSFTLASGVDHRCLVSFNRTTLALNSKIYPFDKDEMQTCVFKTLIESGGVLYGSGNYIPIQNPSWVGSGFFAMTNSATPALRWASPSDYWTGTVAPGTNFILIGGSSRLAGLPANGLARIDLTTGEMDPSFDLQIVGRVGSFDLQGTTLWIAGMDSILGQARRAAKVDLSGTPVLSSFNMSLDGSSSEIVGGSSGVLILQSGQSYGSIKRPGVVAIDTETMAITDWSMDLKYGSYTGSVEALAVSGGRLYIGGDFSTADGEIRRSFAAVKLSDGELDPLTFDIDSTVTGLHPLNGEVYVSGYFNMVNGNSQDYVFRFKESDGQLIAWNPGFDWTPMKFEIKDSILYVGGEFSDIGGNQRYGLASFQLPAHTLTTWNPMTNYGYVYDFAIDGDAMYVGGYLGQNGATPLGNLAKISISTGALDTNFTPSVNYNVEKLTLLNGQLFLRGSFDTVDGQPRAGLASYLLSDFSLTASGAGSGAEGKSFLNVGTNLLLGGEDFVVGDQTTYGLGIFDLNTDAFK